jgi:WD40 repeat protein
MTALRPRKLDDLGSGGETITDIAVSPDGERFAACFANTLVVGVWSSGAQAHRFTGEASIEAIAFSPDGARVVAAESSGVAHIYEIDSGSRISTLQGGTGGYYEVAWSPNGQLIAGGRYEPLVTVFDAGSSQIVATLDPKMFSDEGRTAVAFSRDGASLASTAVNAIVRWSLPQPFVTGGRGVKKKKLAVQGYGFMIDAAFSHDGQTLAGLLEVEGQITLHLWDSTTGKKRGKLPLPHFSQRMAWAADDSFIAVVERDEPGASLWNPNTLQQSETDLEGVPATMATIAAHPQRLALIAGSEEGEVFIWQEA